MRAVSRINDIFKRAGEPTAGLYCRVSTSCAPLERAACDSHFANLASPSHFLSQNCVSCLTGYLLDLCLSNPYDKVGIASASAQRLWRCTWRPAAAAHFLSLPFQYIAELHDVVRELNTQVCCTVRAPEPTLFLPLPATTHPAPRALCIRFLSQTTCTLWTPTTEAFGWYVMWRMSLPACAEMQPLPRVFECHGVCSLPPHVSPAGNSDARSHRLVPRAPRQEGASHFFLFKTALALVLANNISRSKIHLTEYGGGGV